MEGAEGQIQEGITTNASRKKVVKVIYVKSIKGIAKCVDANTFWFVWRNLSDWKCGWAVNVNLLGEAAVLFRGRNQLFQASEGAAGKLANFEGSGKQTNINWGISWRRNKDNGRECTDNDLE